jgi:hypothetical protein
MISFFKCFPLPDASEVCGRGTVPCIGGKEISIEGHRRSWSYQREIRVAWWRWSIVPASVAFGHEHRVPAQK